MLKLLRSKHFYVITTIVLIISIIVMSIYISVCVDMRNEASQLLVDNGISLDEVYDNQDKAKMFTTTSQVTNNTTKVTETTIIENTEPSVNVNVENKTASESNLLALVTKYCNCVYTQNATINYDNAKNQLRSVAIGDAYKKALKELNLLYSDNQDGRTSNASVEFAYFRFLGTSKPEGKMRFNVMNYYENSNSNGTGYTIDASASFSYDADNDVWTIYKLNFTRN
ncbi:MAG: hypothetical protein ACI4HM_00270 [Ruminococcus sp.]